MLFHFSLETLLRFRRSKERQMGLAAIQAAQNVARVRQEIEFVDSSRNGIVAGEIREMETSLPAAQIHFDRLCCSILAERRLELQKELVQLEELRTNCLRNFQRAHREREVVDTLRRRQLEVHRQQENRREQKRLDELFVMGCGFTKRQVT